MIDQNPEAVRGFLAAIEAATDLNNAEPAKWDNLLTEQKLVPAPLVGKYTLPVYPSASVPSQAQWDDVLAWAKAKGLVKNDVKVVNDWESAYYSEYSGSSGKGPRPLVVSYDSSPVFEVIYAETPKDESPTAAVVGDDTCYRQVEFVGI